MLGNLGFSFLLLALITSLYGAVAAFAAAPLGHRRALRSAWVALCCELCLALAASGLLLHALITRDFSLEYVSSHSSTDLPLIYTISAFWASLAGSHLFWTVSLCLTIVVAMVTIKKPDEALKPYLLGTSHLLFVWMFYSLVTHSDPFAPAMRAAEDGAGLNALLQNPYMVAHPPLLFIGYSLLAVPFLYGVAALLSGDRSLSWGTTVRRWSLAAFVVLTIAIALGGRWAYVELGWGGYWAWDPVENSSLLPWLLAMALLHVLILDQRSGSMPGLAVALALLGFISTFFGTFLTRSGIVSSVHAFAKTSVGINYLWFLAIMVACSLLLYGWRIPLLLAVRSRPLTTVRDNTTALTIFVLLAFALVVFTGMLFPIVAEALMGARLSVQAPYYNSFAPYVGMILLLLLATRSLATKGTPVAVVAVCVTVSIATAAIYRYGMAWYAADTSIQYAAVAGIFCVALSFCALGWHLSRLFVRRVVRHRWRVASAGVVHLGATLAILGFIGAYHAKNGQITLLPGEKGASFGRYEFVLQAPVKDRKEDNAVLYETRVAVFDQGRLVGEAKPALAGYPTGGETFFTEVSILSAGFMDIYLILNDWDRANPQGKVTLSVYLNPFVQFVWAAIALMAVGGACGLVARGRKRSEG